MVHDFISKRVCWLCCERLGLDAMGFLRFVFLAFSVVLFVAWFLLCAVFAFGFLLLGRYFVRCPVLFRGFVLLCFGLILL